MQYAMTSSTTKLKQAITEDGRKQYWIAARAGMAESKLSKIVRGLIVPSKEEQEKLAEILGREKGALFSDICVLPSTQYTKQGRAA